MLEMGWSFEKTFSGSSGDSLHNKRYVHEIYQLSDKDISTKATVPILWDKKTNTIVNNESSEIIRIMNNAFNDLTNNNNDYYPEKFRDQIDFINDTIYENINNGVYRSGFSKTQNSYEEAVKNLFTSLDMINDILEGRNYLVGDILTEADIRLVPTLIRFDCVYYFHFNFNLKKISEYKNISRYLRNLFEEDAIKSTTNFEHIKRHYFYSHENINPFRIIPIGPETSIS